MTEYERLNTFGEYKYANRLDTLFVLQLFFIIMLVFIGLYYLNMNGLFSKASMYIVLILLTVILFLIVINKAIVMPKLRSKYVFDRLNFGDGTLTPTGGYTVGGVSGGNQGTSPNETCTTQTVCNSQNLQI